MTDDEQQEKRSAFADLGYTVVEHERGETTIWLLGPIAAAALHDQLKRELSSEDD